MTSCPRSSVNSRLHTRFVALTLAAVPLAGLVSCSAGDQRPNVVVITLDTTRPDFLSCYGYRAEQSPNIDRLAAEGTRFDNAMSASAVTPVSHASILTGEYPYTHGLRVLAGDSGFWLTEEHATVAVEFQESGYETIAVHSALPVSRTFGFEQGFDVFKDLNGEIEDHGGGQKGWDGTKYQRRSDHTTDIALDELARAEGPVFLWMHYWDPHDPQILPPKEFIEHLGEINAWTDDVYAAEIHYMDSEIGRLLDGLEELGLDDNTLIVLTADHGEGMSDGQERHGWHAHRMVYQEQVAVPLIVRPPGGSSTKEVTGLVRTVDVAPTLLDYAGIPRGRERDGVSLRSLCEGGAYVERMGYADQINGYDSNAKMVEKRPDAAFLYCVSDGRWKLTYRPHMPAAGELYDLETDPREVTNLYDPDHAAARRLFADLASRNPWVLAPFPKVDGGREGADSEAMAGLGYAAGTISNVDWAWACPQHPDQLQEERRRCEQCSAILVPVKQQD